MKKIIAIVAGLAILTTSLMAEKTLSVKAADYGVISEDGTSSPLIGLDFTTTSRFKNHIMYGFGAGAYFNNGSFVDGGVGEFDGKLGVTFANIDMYALAGVSYQSLSNDLQSSGFMYGAGIGYVAFDHLSMKVEYKTASLEKDDDISYTLDGLSVGIGYQF